MKIQSLQHHSCLISGNVRSRRHKIQQLFPILINCLQPALVKTSEWNRCCVFPNNLLFLGIDWLISLMLLSLKTPTSKTNENFRCSWCIDLCPAIGWAKKLEILIDSKYYKTTGSVAGTDNCRRISSFTSKLIAKRSKIFQEKSETDSSMPTN